MIIPEQNRKEISKYLFQEGVCYAKKDYNLAKHPLIDVPNLQVIKLMQSFKSKEFVRETFAWMHYYWYLTNDGIEFLRTYLNLPSEIVPATLKKTAGRPMGGPSGDRPRGPARFEGGKPGFGGDREGYRRGPAGPSGSDKSGAPADYQPSFRVIHVSSVLSFGSEFNDFSISISYGFQGCCIKEQPNLLRVITFSMYIFDLRTKFVLLVCMFSFMHPHAGKHLCISILAGIYIICFLIWCLKPYK